MLGKLTTAKWKYGKRWVYSITYDEALYELHQYAIPTHEKFGIPGHLEVVSCAIGEVRQIGASSYNGFHHMSGPQLREMIRYGWGVGCHSWDHTSIMADPELQLYKARLVLEDAIGRGVTVYVAPGDNSNLVPPIPDLVKQYGYLAAMGLADQLNYADSDVDDLFILQRPALHEKMTTLYDRIFDPFNRISQAKKQEAWLMDYNHCPLPTAVHDYKDINAAHHRERLQTVADEGKYDCWFANPDDVVDYRYMRRYTKISETADGWALSQTELPGPVMNRELTFLLETIYTPESLVLTVDGKEIPLQAFAPGVLLFTAAVSDRTAITLRTRFE